MNKKQEATRLFAEWTRTNKAFIEQHRAIIQKLAPQHLAAYDRRALSAGQLIEFTFDDVMNPV